MTSYNVSCTATRGTEPTLFQCYDVHIAVCDQLNEFVGMEEKRRRWVLC